MKKITIILPDSKGMWKVGYKNYAKKKTVMEVFHFVKKKASLATSKHIKTAVMVKTDLLAGSRLVNESLPSSSFEYLLWVTVCFLEDYLNKQFVVSIEKKYGGSLPS